MAEMDKDGWGEVPGSANWKCPDCNKWTPYEDWREQDDDNYRKGCPGRICPHCGALFDYIYGANRISDAMWEEVQANFF